MTRTLLTMASFALLTGASSVAWAQAGPDSGADAAAAGATVDVPAGTPGAQGGTVSVFQVAPTAVPAPSASEPGVNAHLGSSAQASADVSSSADGFDFARPGANGVAVRGSEKSVYIVAGKNVPELHTVARGDTLWGISDKYFGNPYNWPRVWAQNPQVQNPHWLYPGDHVRLRSGQGGFQSSSIGFVREPALVSSAARFVPHRGMVSDAKVATWGEVIGSPDDQMLLSVGDDIYVRLESERKVKAGQLLTIFEPRVVKNLHNAELVWVRGYAKVGRINSETNMVRARIVEAIDTIERGMLVGPMEQRVDLVEPVRNKRALRARIMGALYPHEFYGQHQVVFIDKGTTDGVEIGNRFVAVTRGDDWRLGLKTAGALADDRAVTEDDAMARVEGTPDTDSPTLYPAETYAEIMVIRVRENSAACMVTAAIREIPRGALVIARKGY